MFSHYQHSSDSDENVLDGHKKKTRTTKKTPAATTQPTTSEQCFEHVIETRSYQLNADTLIFNASDDNFRPVFVVRIAMYATRTLYTYGDLVCFCFTALPRIRCSLTRIHISYTSRTSKPVLGTCTCTCLFFLFRSDTRCMGIYTRSTRTSDHLPPRLHLNLYTIYADPGGGGSSSSEECIPSPLADTVGLSPVSMNLLALSLHAV